MTKREAEAYFKAYILPGVKAHYEQDGRPDWPARSEAWSYYIDGLCKDGEITGKQYHNWSAPAVCGR